MRGHRARHDERRERFLHLRRHGARARDRVRLDRAANGHVDHGSTIGLTYDSSTRAPAGGGRAAATTTAAAATASRAPTVTLRAGQHVVIVVDGFNAGMSGMFVFYVSHVTDETVGASALPTTAQRRRRLRRSRGHHPIRQRRALLYACAPKVATTDSTMIPITSVTAWIPNCSTSPSCCMPTTEICDDFMDDDCHADPLRRPELHRSPADSSRAPSSTGLASTIAAADGARTRRRCDRNGHGGIGDRALRGGHRVTVLKSPRSRRGIVLQPTGLME